MIVGFEITLIFQITWVFLSLFSGEIARLKTLLEAKVNADSGKTCEDPGYMSIRHNHTAFYVANMPRYILKEK